MSKVKVAMTKKHNLHKDNMGLLFAYNSRTKDLISCIYIFHDIVHQCLCHDLERSKVKVTTGGNNVRKAVAHFI